MMTTLSFAAAGLLALVLAQTVAAQPAAASTSPKAPLGRWITESGNLEVEIAPCAAQALCGKVVRVMANRSMSGPGPDMVAADQRPALGMTLLTGLRESGSAGSGTYQGEIYNRENAKTYRVNVTPAEPDQLLVHGYVGIPLFGKTQVWRRPAVEQGAAQ
ncbi:DUF2147 domain-containing protein [Acidovorax sp. RAC01]|uniref:DUF2147 domain-containing protein n=1 Tax=Acidovorax sp. RAC01 TaxID=1842533 RepID=UPI000858EF56|nr:DUF2147 domain-containing protein [Acidovorax sp. RAC01]AOG21636.1 hypothetical protein BSY15_1456 [Acidovorax sp. RAC01]